VKKKFLLSIITTSLVFIGVQAELFSATGKLSPLNMEKASEEQTQSLSPAQKFL
jgi:hypothetical protein